MIITMMNTGNLSGNIEWAEQNGLSHPVLVDPGGLISQRFDRDRSVPGFTLLSPQTMEITVLDGNVIPDLDL